MNKQDVIEFLKTALKAAKKGEIVSFVGAFLDENDKFYERVNGKYIQNLGLTSKLVLDIQKAHENNSKDV